MPPSRAVALNGRSSLFICRVAAAMTGSFSRFLRAPRAVDVVDLAFCPLPYPSIFLPPSSSLAGGHEHRLTVLSMTIPSVSRRSLPNE